MIRATTTCRILSTDSIVVAPRWVGADRMTSPVFQSLHCMFGGSCTPDERGSGVQHPRNKFNIEKPG